MGNSIKIVKALGIDKALLYRWRKELSQYKNNSFTWQGNPEMTDLERENARLQKELRDAIMMESTLLKEQQKSIVSDIPINRLAP